MEVALIGFITSLSEVTQIEALNLQEHRIVRRTNAIPGSTVTIAVSQSEPHDTILPDNVLWACFNKLSPMYKQMFRRTSRNPDPVRGTVHTWKKVKFMHEIWQDQYFASGEEPGTGATIATVTARGIVTISDDAQDPDMPVVVSVEDPRNTDARTPLPHDEMHANKPAEQFVQDSGNLSIVGGTPVLGSVMLGTSGGPTNHVKMDLAHICEDEPEVPPATKDPSTIAEAPYSGKINFGGTIVNKFEGYPATTVLTIKVALYGMGLNARGMRKFLGYFNPSTLKVNGQVVSGNKVTIASGENAVEVAITAPGHPSLVLKETLKGV